MIVAVIYFKFKNYYKSTYYHITKNSIFSVYYDIGKLGEYMTYVKLKKYEKIGGRFLFNLYLPKENGENKSYGKSKKYNIDLLQESLEEKIEILQ